MDMQKYLQDTKALIRDGKHKEALERCIWFHEHALEHQPSMSGVRLSFALADWKDLGVDYPPAKAAMIEIRDRSAKQIIATRGRFELFHDVMALNRTLDEDAKTVELFETLDKTYPKQAKLAWIVAKKNVIEAKRFDLAKKYIGNVIREFDVVKERYDQNLKLYDDPKIGDARFKAYNENHFVEESLQLIAVALAIDEPAAAKEVQKLAQATVDDRRLRDAIPGEAKQAPQK